MNKIFFVTTASATPGVERFAKSLKVIEKQIEHISIQFKPTIPFFKPYVVYDKPYPGHINRWQYIPQLDDNRFIVFSDTDDVVFQREFPDFERMKYEVYVGNENIKHKDSYWKQYIDRNPYFEVLNDRYIYNCGCFAMRGYVIKKLITFMKDNLIFTKDEDKPFVEQLLFNMFFVKNPYYDVYSKIDIFCPLYNNLELKTIRVRKGLFSLGDGHVPVAIHANGNNKGVLDDGRKLNKFVKK